MRSSSITTISDAIILAAGLGTRLRPFSDRCPKPLLPVMGVPTIQFALDLARAAGAKRVAVNVHHLADRMESGLRACDTEGFDLLVSDERARLLGSGGGARKAMGLLGEGPFLLGNADTMSSFDPKALFATHQRRNREFGALLTLALLPIPERMGPYSAIRWDERSGKVLAIEKPANEGWFYAGWSIVEKELLSRFPPDRPGDLLREGFLPAIAEGRAAGFAASGAWFDIGSPALWAETHFGVMRLLDRGEAPPAWSERIERVNVRLGAGCYALSGAPSEKTRAGSAPLYLACDEVPASAGPRAVLYGSLESVPAREEVIAYGGLSEPLQK